MPGKWKNSVLIALCNNYQVFGTRTTLFEWHVLIPTRNIFSTTYSLTFCVKHAQQLPHRPSRQQSATQFNKTCLSRKSSTATRCIHASAASLATFTMRKPALMRDGHVENPGTHCETEKNSVRWQGESFYSSIVLITTMSQFVAKESSKQQLIQPANIRTLPYSTGYSQ